MYKPNTKNSSREIPYMALVAQVDPEHERSKHYAPEYTFARRVFMADPARRGAFNSNSNTYPVGQQSGAADPAYAQRPFFGQIEE
jgi:hypothetical protein